MDRTVLRVIAGLILATFLLWLLWKRLKKPRSPEGWVGAEEAARREHRAKLKWAKIREEQGGELTEDQPYQAFMEIMQAGAIGYVDFKGIRLTILMPLAIGPVDRCARFEDPLIEALGDLGVISGGGSLMSEEEGRMRVQEVDIGVIVKDLDRGLVIIRDVLKKQGAPRGTRIVHREQQGEKEYPLFE